MIRRFAIILLTALAAFNVDARTNVPASAQEAPPSQGTVKLSKPAQPVLPTLSRAERKRFREKLDPKYRTFLDTVDPIIVPQELDLFLSLHTDAHRDAFIDSFWSRRDPQGAHPGTYREDYLARRDEAKAKFERLDSDRARVYLLQGRPAEQHDIDCPRYLQPIQLWRYQSLPGAGRTSWLVFYQPRSGVEYRLWSSIPQRGNDALNELLSQEAIVDGETVASIFTPQSAQPFGGIGGSVAGSSAPRKLDTCSGADLLLSVALNQTSMPSGLAAAAMRQPKVEEEALRQFASTLVGPAAEDGHETAKETTKKAAALKADPTQNPGVRKLSRRERKDRIAALGEKYRQFLLDVEPIMQPVELNTFLLLESDAQRDLYIDDFWRRRDVYTHSADSDYRRDYYERLEEAKSMFKYISSDRSKMYLIHGRPDDVLRSDCREYLQPIEIWHYGFIPGQGHDIVLLFYQPRMGNEYRLWIPMGDMQDELGDLLSSEIAGSMGVQRGVQFVFYDSAGGGGSQVSKIYFSCKYGQQILDAIFKSQQNRLEMGKLWDAPKVNEEDVNRILKATVLSDPNAPKFPAELSATYPGKRGARTATQLTALVDRDELLTKDINGAKFYDIDVTGEIIRDGRMYENFRYRFDYPAETASQKIPVVVDRFIRPGNYKARLKIVDANSGAEAIVEKDLEVPYIQDSPQKEAAAQEGSDTVNRLQKEFWTGESRLRIVPLPDELVTGLQKIDTIVSGDKITSVDFYVDGRKIMSKRTPPFSLELNLGDVPRIRTVRAVGLNDKGTPLAADQLTINEGRDPFRVKIVSPQVAVKAAGALKVELECKIPQGKKLKSLELYLNETKVGTLYSPPFITSVNVPPDLGVGYLRAVATLQDSSYNPVEDVVFINTPEFMQQIDVHLVELPTSVLEGNEPVLNLKESDFKVFDGGKQTKIARFDYVKDLPLSIGLAVDSSGSMLPRMDEAQKAGAEFFQRVLRPGDKAFVVGFDTQPMLVQKWSSHLSALNAGLASLRAEEATALYDAIVYSLYNFQGIRGQKALVVITDGKDTASKFTFEQALEYARRLGVPIYTIGIGLNSSEIDVRYKLTRFASETGGNAYYIERASDLRKIYSDIENQLRSQYVLGIYPPPDVKPGSEWREVRVEVSKGKAKTVRGYYP
ncbi:MAG: VWA domain-containing protein [Thermoanaerobaculia bacterium]